MEQHESAGSYVEPGIRASTRWFALGVRVVALLVLAGTVTIISIRLWDIPRCLPLSETGFTNVFSSAPGCSQRRQYIEGQILTAVEGLFFTALLFVGAHLLEQLAGQSAGDEEPEPGDGPAADADEGRA